MKKLAYSFIVVAALFALNAAALQAQTLVDQWGRTTFQTAAGWPILNTASTPAGDASIGSATPHPSGWATLRGGFDDIELTTGQTVVISGKLEFVGGGGDNAYGPLRYALTYDAGPDTLKYQYTDSALWTSSTGNNFGYQFTPRTGTGVMANGAGGTGTIWRVNNGTWVSTNSNGGPALAPIQQAPRNAQMVEGVYDWAISVQVVDDTTNEVRWYLVEENQRYWFGGTVVDTAVIKTYNGILFGLGDDLEETGQTQFNLTGVQVGLGDPIDVPEAPWEPYFVDLWGTTPQGSFFQITNDSTTLVGDASIVGTAPINGDGQATVRGGFGQDLQIPTDEALIVRGELELVGTLGAESSYNPLRFALANHANDTLRNALTDSARWVRGPGSGYIWCPRTGAGVVANGAWGSGTVGVLNNGNWNSTNSNGGPALATILQAPRNAQMIAGTYEWAISVQAVDDTTNEIRWYLIEEDTRYWFGGVITAPAVTHALNAINFGVNTGDWTEVNVLATEVDYGPALTIPEAPFEPYFVDLWGSTSQGRSWPILNDANTLVGDASMSGPNPIPGNGWATVRGGFGQDLLLKTEEALIVTGQIEFVGATGGGNTYTPLRYGITYHANDTLNNALTDSAAWVRGTGSGYGFHPRSGGGTMSNGNGGVGTIWTLNNGNWNSTFSNNGGPLAAINQAPRNAELAPGTYDWAISVQAVNDTTNEIRWYLIEEDIRYWFGGIVTGPATTDRLNGICFGVNTGGWTEVNILAVEVDYGAPIDVPVAPFESYFVDSWGFIGDRFGGWSFTPGEFSGNATISGDAPATGFAALRGGLEAIAPTTENALVVTGSVEFVGGGFETSGSFRFGLFNGTNAGNVILDGTPDNGDSTRWSGSEENHSGYLFIPQSGANGPVDWHGTAGTWGGIVDGTWFDTGNASSYALGSQLHANAAGGAGTYDFAISVQPKGDGTNEVRVSFTKSDGSYLWEASVIDNHAPVATETFNSIAFGLNTTGATTAMNILDVQVDLGDPIPLAVEEGNDPRTLLPTEYALGQNYPNPFNPSTTIEFALPKSGKVDLVVYDILGRVVAELATGNLNAGYHKITFEGTDLASGIYFFRLKAGDFVSVKKAMLLK